MKTIATILFASIISISAMGQDSAPAQNDGAQFEATEPLGSGRTEPSEGNRHVRNFLTQKDLMLLNVACKNVVRRICGSQDLGGGGYLPDDTEIRPRIAHHKLDQAMGIEDAKCLLKRSDSRPTYRANKKGQFCGTVTFGDFKRCLDTAAIIKKQNQRLLKNKNVASR